MMKRESIVVCFTLILTFFTGALNCASAETWVPYYQSETEKYYYDKAKVTKTPQGSIVLTRKITALSSGGEETEKVVQSMELNCKKWTYRIIPANGAKEAAPKDIVTGKGKDGGWTEISLASAMGSLYQNVCQKAQGKEKPVEMY